MESNMLNKILPDVALESRTHSYPKVDWVGMDSIEMPVLLKIANEVFRIPSRIEAKVSLDKKESRGIHMSRLYLAVQDGLSQRELSLRELSNLSEEFLRTHQDLSSHAKLSVQLEVPILRPALVSQNKAWRNYPVKLSVVNSHGEIRTFLEVQIIYSSTCPASAALARQLIQNNFAQTFADKELNFNEVYHWLGSSQGILATPHAQRSFANVKVEVNSTYNFIDLIDLLEDELGTAVQAAVKREDEQEFSLRNGQNLMFCEDAARRLKQALESEAGILDYFAEVKHAESLHPHDAVALVSKGLRLNSF